jgi:signal transduction histidine kinase
VVSRDSGVFQLCTRVISEAMPDQSCSIQAVAPGGHYNDADLYIWDFQPNVSLPDHINWTYSNLIVLAHRRDMAEVSKVFGFEPHIVLKPITRATLSAFIGLAISNRAANSMREDRDNLFQCLIEANVKLQEYDHERTNFLTRVVHDFRAPLTALNGYCGLLLGNPLGSLNENQQEVIRRMQYSVRRLSRLSSAMLELTVERQIKHGPNLQRADLPKSFDQALQEVGYLAKDKNLVVRCALDPCDDRLYFDSGQMDQVLVNILDNACKFAVRNGWIEIRGYPFFWERRGSVTSIDAPPKERRICDRTEPNSYRVDISDSGPAIAAEHLTTIFEEYTSYTKGPMERAGAGLGLAICRMIMEQHGGRVWAENTDKGPMFSIVLPLCKFGSAQVAQGVLSA